MEHDIITRDAYSVSWADIIDAVTISKVIVFEMICNVADHSAAKFLFPIEQPYSTPNAASGDLGNWRWNRIMFAVAT